MTAVGTFEFRQQLDGTDPGQAFAIIERWANEQKARGRVRRPPAYLEIVHGTKFQMMGWKKDASKTIQFHIGPTPTGTMVTVRIIPSLMYSGDIEILAPGKARQNFEDLLGEIWIRAGLVPTGPSGQIGSIGARPRAGTGFQILAVAVAGLGGIAGFVSVRQALSAGTSSERAAYLGAIFLTLIGAMLVVRWANKRKSARSLAGRPR